MRRRVPSADHGKFKGDECINIIQRVEQEMRVKLVSQVLQLCFGATFLRFTTGGFSLSPTGTHADGRTQSDGEDEA